MIALPGYWGDILLAQGMFVLATVSPGPAFLATIGTAMSSGRKAAVVLGLGVVAGSLTWAVVAALGLSGAIAAHQAVAQAIRIAGGLYLLFLAWKAWRTAFASQAALALRPMEMTRTSASQFLRGLAIHLTNPKAILAWATIIAVGIKPGAPFWVPAAIIAGAMAFALCFYTLSAVAFSTERVLELYSAARRWIDGVLGLFFVYAAARLLGIV